MSCTKLNPTISFIIPVGTINEYLDNAIKSIYELKKFNIDLEIIIILDRNVDKIKSTYLKNKQVKFFKNNTNLVGPGIARNIGIQKSKGLYISFVDSDDEIIASNFSKVFHKLILGEDDIIEFNYDFFGKSLDKRNRDCELEKVTKKNSCYMLLRGELRDEAIFQIYKKSLIINNKIKFPHGIYEDILFRFITLKSSKKKSISYLSAYKKRIHTESITAMNKHIINQKEYMRQIMHIKNEYKDNQNVQDALKYRMIAFAGLIAQNIISKSAPNEKTDVLENLFHELCAQWNLYELKEKTINLTKRETLIKEFLLSKTREKGY